MGCNVRCWHIADKFCGAANVRYVPTADIAPVATAAGAPIPKGTDHSISRCLYFLSSRPRVSLKGERLRTVRITMSCGLLMIYKGLSLIHISEPTRLGMISY